MGNLKVDNDILKRINKIGFAASLIGKVSTGEADMNTGNFPIDDCEVYETMSHLILAEIEELVEYFENNTQGSQSVSS